MYYLSTDGYTYNYGMESTVDDKTIKEFIDVGHHKKARFKTPQRNLGSDVIWDANITVTQNLKKHY